MQVYELGYLLLPSIAEDALSTAVEKIKASIAKAGGTEIDGEEPVTTELAYAMSKTVGASRYVVNEAYLGWVKFELEPVAVTALKEEVSTMDEVLRALLIKAPRESDFTFAKAALAEAEREAKKNAPVAEVAPVAEAVVE
jgi:ribosomal protein S6